MKLHYPGKATRKFPSSLADPIPISYPSFINELLYQILQKFQTRVANILMEVLVNLKLSVKDIQEKPKRWQNIYTHLNNLYNIESRSVSGLGLNNKKVQVKKCIKRLV